MKRLYTLLESPTFLRFPDLYHSPGISEARFSSARQFNKAIAKTAPDLILAEFIYGFGNNYAGINVSTLEASLYALQRHAPQAKVLIIVDKTEQIHAPKLKVLFHIDAVLTLPVTALELKAAIGSMVI